MAMGDIIYSIITLILMVLIISSPFIRKMIKSAGKHSKGDVPSEESIYESVDSHRVVERILSEKEVVKNIRFTDPEPLRQLVDLDFSEQKPTVEKLAGIASLKRAVIWKEVLDKPLALRESDW